MDVKVIRDGHLLVRVNGEVDYSNSEELDSALRCAVRDAPTGFVIDLTSVEYMDSAGVQSLLSAYKGLMKSGGRLAVVVTDSNVKGILDIINANRLPNFFICGSVKAAELALDGNT
jgi:anti-anti-sigma factor